MSVTVIAFAVNDKFPLGFVYRQFAKHLKDPFEFVVLNDAQDKEASEGIASTASAGGIRCVRVPQDIHTDNGPSLSYAQTLNWAVREFVVNNAGGLVVFIHADIFPICDVSLSSIIGEYAIASTMEFRALNGLPITHIYPTLTIINPNKIENAVESLNFGCADGLDTGGMTRAFVENNQSKIKFLVHHQVEYFARTLHSDDAFAAYLKADIAIARQHGLSAGWICEGFYHYMAGSQWNITDEPAFSEGHDKRARLFREFYGL